MPALLLLTAALFGGPAIAAADNDGLASYAALRDARPDGRTVAVEQLSITRDAFTFDFERGTFHLLAPVDGRTIGAVFLGEGSYVLRPASEHERRHLAFVRGERGLETVRDRFTELVLLFVDDTDREIQLQQTAQMDAPSPKAIDAYNRFLRVQRKDLEVNLHVRLLQDLLNTPGNQSGIFLAFVDGDALPPALLAVDPRGVEALRLGLPLLGAEDTMMLVIDSKRGGLWYLSDRDYEIARGKAPRYAAPVDALHYSLDTTITNRVDLRGETTITFRTQENGLRLLPVDLLPSLRVTDAQVRVVAVHPDPKDAAGPVIETPDARWQAAAVVQEHEDADATLAILAPTALPQRADVELRLTYAGAEVLQDVGDNNYVVGARTSWYPNFSVFRDPATFTLTYRVPKDHDVVSVGRMLETATTDAQVVSRWQADDPIRVAGFNYGRFERSAQVDEQSGIEMQVYTNPGTPDIIREINSIIQASGGGGFGGVTSEEGRAILSGASASQLGGGPGIERVNTARLAESALVDAINAARIGDTYFGALPQRHVAITQQAQWTFGQSWPSLIFLPYVSFMSSTLRAQLGFGLATSGGIEELGFHELAHQWWGHLVGWDSYRDQWLSEGFAEFTAELTAQHMRGWDASVANWKNKRDLITAKLQSPMPQYEVGPLTQGFRLSTGKSPAAYSVITYSKGAFVLHMLRMMMWEGRAEQPDGRFIAMMRDFVATHTGGAPSTADFQAIVQKHMTPSMNATGDGRIDWFFDQWVYGSAVPTLTSKLKIKKAGRGKYQIVGQVAQKDVDREFRTLVPLYLDFGRNQPKVQFGTLPMIGEMTRDVDVTLELPRKPKKAVINARMEVLAKIED
ncbi:MAG: M1 family aminopeptidase [Acidobacteriota bacterium]